MLEAEKTDLPEKCTWFTHYECSEVGGPRSRLVRRLQYYQVVIYPTAIPVTIPNAIPAAIPTVNPTAKTIAKYRSMDNYFNGFVSVAMELMELHDLKQEICLAA